MSVTILRGDCRKTLRTLAAESVNCVVTSPPYWSLRDYGTAPLKWPAIRYAPMAGLPACVKVPAMTCSLGLEPTVESFIGHMVLIFREVRRVLRDDGTCWVNMGDSYAGSRSTAGDWQGSLNGPQPNHAANARQSMVASRRRDNEPVPRSDIRVKGLKPKDLVGQPWRLALALQADGWWLRSDVIWHKRNPMPESTRDRPTKAHEYIFLLSKSARYYYDQDAIKEPSSPDTHERYARARDGGKWAEDSPNGNTQTIARTFDHMKKPVAGWASGGSHTAIEHARPHLPGNKTHRGTDAYENGDEFHRTKGGLVKYAEKVRKLADVGSGTKNNASFDAAMAVMPADRNKRSVWTVATEGFKEAHFATFPTDLILPCILAGCPPGGTVLDIFGGSGTTGLVSDQHQRDAVLCELSDEYIEIMRRRVTGDTPLLTEVKVA
jgi:DNA modification methylase